jgi:DNA-binding transcriptional MocR family regulator
MDNFKYIQGIRAWRFTTNAKIVGVMLASRYNWTKMACAWPSNKLIAADTGLSISAVVKAKKELVDAGFLDVQRQYNNSCKYTPMLPENIGDVMENYTSSFRNQSYDFQDESYYSETSLKDNIKDNIKEKRKEKLQDDDSNESSLDISNTKNKSKEDIQVEEYRQSDNSSLADFKAQAAASPWEGWR